MAKPIIRTLTADLPPDRVGFTLSHEHVYCDFAAASGDPDLAFIDESEILSDLRDAYDRGAQMLVEVSTYDMGAAPRRVARLCRDAGLTAVKSTGWFRSPSLDPFVTGTDADGLAARLIADICSGFPETDLRAGVIGEIGMRDLKPSRAECAALEAAAAAAVATGAGVIAHTDSWAAACAIVAELTSRGVPRHRIMVGHCRSADPLAGTQELAQSGVMLAFDQLGHPERDPAGDVSDRIAALLERGCGSQLVISADVGRRSRLRFAGGSGYMGGVRDLLGELMERGVGKSITGDLTRTNPARFLTLSNAAVGA